MRLLQSLSSNRDKLKSITESRIAQFSDSWQLWAFSVVIGVLTACIVWLLQSSAPATNRIVFSLVGLAGGSIAFGLLAFVALRPFIKRRLQTVLPEIVASYNKTGLMIQSAEKHLVDTLTTLSQQIEAKLKSDIAREEDSAANRIAKLKEEYDQSKRTLAETEAARRRDLLANFTSGIDKIAQDSQVNVKSLEQSNLSRLQQAQTSLTNSMQQELHYEDQMTAYMRARVRMAIANSKRRFEDVADQVQQLCPEWPDDSKLSEVCPADRTRWDSYRLGIWISRLAKNLLIRFRSHKHIHSK